MRPSVSTALAGFAGVATGVIAASILLPTQAPAPTAVPSVSVSPYDTARPTVSVEQGPRGFVRQSENAGDVTSDEPPPPPSPLPSTPEDMTQMRLESEQEHAIAVSAHYEAVRDVGWAGRKEAELGQELDTLLRDELAGIALSSLDCRSETCVAQLNWPSFLQARETFAGLVRHHYESSLNCSREMILPQPSDPSSPYSGHLLFRCSREQQQ